MLTRSGGPSGQPIVKLLDFGLAKLKVSPVSALSALPTQDSPVTVPGTILGTLQYMAPEQLEGGEADARTDIVAFGAVVYEMVTGRKAFAGKSQASLIGAIMHSEPAPLTAHRRRAGPHAVRARHRRPRAAGGGGLGGCDGSVFLPAGAWIGFERGTTLVKVASTGGPPQEIVDADANVLGGT